MQSKYYELYVLTSYGCALSCSSNVVDRFIAVLAADMEYCSI